MLICFVLIKTIQIILFGNYNETVQDVYNATTDIIGNDGNQHNDYVYTCVNRATGNRHEPTIDYCSDHACNRFKKIS